MTTQDLTTKVAQAPEPQVVLEMETWFPFDLIPDKIVLSSLSLVVIERYLLSSQTTTFQIKDILSVELNTSLIFASVGIVRRLTTLATYMIGPLRIPDAEKLKNMLQGLMLLDTEKVDVVGANTRQVRQKAETMGATTAT